MNVEEIKKRKFMLENELTTILTNKIQEFERDVIKINSIDIDRISTQQFGALDVAELIGVKIEIVL